LFLYGRVYIASKLTEILVGLLGFLVLADLYNTQGEYEKQYHLSEEVVDGYRDARINDIETSADLCQDDREFDGKDVPPGMRIIVGERLSTRRRHSSAPLYCLISIFYS
jgi:hypothetical protein